MNSSIIKNDYFKFPHVCLSSLIFLVLLFQVYGQAIREDVMKHPNWKLLDQKEDCGLSSSNRIIGGRHASLGQYPWIARIGYSILPKIQEDSDNFFPCGGVIISDRYILTAAHCTPQYQNVADWLNIDMVDVRLGEHKAYVDPDCEDGVCAPPVQDIPIEEFYCHPGYTREIQRDDICVIRLAKPIVFNRYVQPICLPVYEWFDNKTFEGKVFEVAGWGITDIVKKTTSDVLLTLKVPVVSDSRCQQEFNTTAKQLCAGGVVGQDSCGGDSGGPLMTPLSVDAPPRYFLMGIVSYGYFGCATKASPGVYTKVTGYLTWILDHIRE